MKPDFICIGAPKAGTTWLSNNLQKHPDIWIPPVKELHYFDRQFPIEKVAEKKYIKRGLLGFYPSYNRKQLVRIFGRAVLQRSLTDIVWANRYFAGPLSDSWYVSLFQRNEDKVCGELTTDYCALSEEGVEYVGKLLPNAKIIFLLRNPVDRAWSHSRMLLPELLGKSLEDVSEEEFIAYLTHPAVKRKGEYLRSLDIWSRYFQSRQIFVGFYDEIKAGPEQLLRGIFEFLGVNSELGDYTLVRRRVNVGRGSVTIPPNIHMVLADEYRKELNELAARVGGHVEKWRKSITYAST